MNRILKKAFITKRRNRALTYSVGIHLIAMVALAIYLFLTPAIEEIEESIAVDILPPPKRQFTPKKRIDRVIPTERPSVSVVSEIKKLPASSGSIGRIDDPSRLDAPSLDTVTRLAPKPESLLSPGGVDAPEISPGVDDVSIDGVDIGRGTGGKAKQGVGVGRGRGYNRGTGIGAAGELGEGIEDALGDTPTGLVQSNRDEIGDKLGSTIDESDGVTRGHIRLIRLKHNLSDWWQDPTAIPSLIKWLLAHQPNITADMDYMGGALKLTDKDIMDAPLVIMTGHDQAMSVSYKQLKNRNQQATQFTQAERAVLREYILTHNGMLFFDYCGNDGNEASFAHLVENELRTIFPEHALTTLDNMRHDIFNCYFKLSKTPIGGSFFWGTDYKGGNVKWRHLKGIHVPGKLGKPRLAVVFCPLDYLCSMETAEVDSRAPLASRRSSDVYRFMTNMFVYQMRQRK